MTIEMIDDDLKYTMIVGGANVVGIYSYYSYLTVGRTVFNQQCLVLPVAGREVLQRMIHLKIFYKYRDFRCCSHLYTRAIFATF